MRARLAIAAFALALALPAGAARATCYYDGAWDARTTLAQEFRDARWVVRARVVAAEDGAGDDVHDRLPWTRYRLQLLQSYKGRVPARFNFFTDRSSGGFYLDRAAGAHDIGGEYLLFLNPRGPASDDPPEARGAAFVNYNCGQSRSWAEVGSADRRALVRLSGAASLRR